VPLAEQQRNAILDDGTTESIANTGTTVAQRDILAAGAPFLMELIGQNVV
jgi:hypothetical protein